MSHQAWQRPWLTPFRNRFQDLKRKRLQNPSPWGRTLPGLSVVRRHFLLHQAHLRHAHLHHTHLHHAHLHPKLGCPRR